MDRSIRLTLTALCSLVVLTGCPLTSPDTASSEDKTEYREIHLSAKGARAAAEVQFKDGDTVILKAGDTFIPPPGTPINVDELKITATTGLQVCFIDTDASGNGMGPQPTLFLSCQDKLWFPGGADPIDSISFDNHGWYTTDGTPEGTVQLTSRYHFQPLRDDSRRKSSPFLHHHNKIILYNSGSEPEYWLSDGTDSDLVLADWSKYEPALVTSDGYTLYLLLHSEDGEVSINTLTGFESAPSHFATLPELEERNRWDVLALLGEHILAGTADSKYYAIPVNSPTEIEGPFHIPGYRTWLSINNDPMVRSHLLVTDTKGDEPAFGLLASSGNKLMHRSLTSPVENMERSNALGFVEKELAITVRYAPEEDSYCEALYVLTGRDWQLGKDFCASHTGFRWHSLRLDGRSLYFNAKAEHDDIYPEQYAAVHMPDLWEPHSVQVVDPAEVDGSPFLHVPAGDTNFIYTIKYQDPEPMAPRLLLPFAKLYAVKHADEPPVLLAEGHTLGIFGHVATGVGAANQPVIGNRLVFALATASYGLEPWSSDGTAESTNLLKDLNPGEAFGLHPMLISH